jgi:hypothetical protein
VLSSLFLLFSLNDVLSGFDLVGIYRHVFVVRVSIDNHSKCEVQHFFMGFLGTKVNRRIGHELKQLTVVFLRVSMILEAAETVDVGRQQLEQHWLVE